nr:MAG TPA: FeoB-associated Cys-rich membrane protein [Caudoviricetes sp.]
MTQFRNVFVIVLFVLIFIFLISDRIENRKKF